jgi:tRNA uridine 5-carboxymethylaminomethyl modification enzyme
MFTSRAEYRLLLREDNADLRLCERGRELGIVGDDRWRAFSEKRQLIEQESARLESILVRPADVSEDDQARVFGDALSREYPALDLLKRPNVSYAALTSLPGVGPGVGDPRVREQIEIQARYHGYIQRQREEIECTRASEGLRLPGDLDYAEVRGLANEVREKLARHRPETLGQASRISGVTPAAISLLLIHLKKKTLAGVGPVPDGAPARRSA